MQAIQASTVLVAWARRVLQCVALAGHRGDPKGMTRAAKKRATAERHHPPPKKMCTADPFFTRSTVARDNGQTHEHTQGNKETDDDDGMCASTWIESKKIVHMLCIFCFTFHSVERGKSTAHSCVQTGLAAANKAKPSRVLNCGMGRQIPGASTAMAARRNPTHA